jgi:beta-fructofuranosidase
MKLSRRKLLSGTAALAGTTLARQSFSLASALAAASAAQLAADPRRPQYHLLPAANWMNDPNGPIFWRGQYHMFYQYNPHAAVAADMHWGHAVSPDMVHWRHLPVALAPTPGGPDAAGCWTGTAVPDGDRVAVLYAGVASAPENEATIRDGAHSLRESQCLAFSTGDLTHWTKVPNPVIAAPPPGLDVTGFRDPVPWRQGDTWYCAVGSGIRGQGGAVLLYRSSDLYHWNYLHTLHHGDPTASSAVDPVASGDMWECPDFFPLGGKHVLIHSGSGKAFWQTGTLDTDAMIFHPERSGVLDYGAFYAPKSQLDQHGNRILWGWIQEKRPQQEYSAAGWAGVMSLPRILTLDSRGDLQSGVAPAVETLRHHEQPLRLTGQEASDRQQLARMTIQNASGEVLCSLRRTTAPIEISLVASDAAGKPWLTCRRDPSRPNEILIEDQWLPLGSDPGPDAGSIELRFYIDGSVVECFANHHGTLTQRVYFEGSAAPNLTVQVKGSLQSLDALSLWQMSPISPNRLTT